MKIRDFKTKAWSWNLWWLSAGETEHCFNIRMSNSLLHSPPSTPQRFTPTAVLSGNEEQGWPSYLLADFPTPCWVLLLIFLWTIQLCESLHTDSGVSEDKCWEGCRKFWCSDGVFPWLEQEMPLWAEAEWGVGTQKGKIVGFRKGLLKENNPTIRYYLYYESCAFPAQLQWSSTLHRECGVTVRWS